MKKCICSVFLVFSVTLVVAQEKPVSHSSEWEFSTEANFYFFPGDFILLPVVKADKNKLHLEARYNYEDLSTFSAWVGYNFQGGNKFEYLITPMIGGVVGLSKGIAPGLELTLSYKGFELYSEGEYFFDEGTSENNFAYFWTDLTYSPNDWLWFGISGQRTRLYTTDLDIQRGLVIGAGLKKWELSTYYYNPGYENPFVILTLSKGF